MLLDPLTTWCIFLFLSIFYFDFVKFKWFVYCYSYKFWWFNWKLTIYVIVFVSSLSLKRSNFVKVMEIFFIMYIILNIHFNFPLCCKKTFFRNAKTFFLKCIVFFYYNFKVIFPFNTSSSLGVFFFSSLARWSMTRAKRELKIFFFFYLPTNEIFLRISVNIWRLK